MTILPGTADAMPATALFLIPPRCHPASSRVSHAKPACCHTQAQRMPPIGLICTITASWKRCLHVLTPEIVIVNFPRSCRKSPSLYYAIHEKYSQRVVKTTRLRPGWSCPFGFHTRLRPFVPEAVECGSPLRQGRSLRSMSLTALL